MSIYDNYADLHSYVKSELNRTDLTDSQIDQFIRIAERKCWRTLRIPTMELRANLTVTQPDRDTDPDALAESNIPADLLEPKLFTSSTGYKIQWVSAQFIRSLNQTVAVENNELGPEYVTREKNQFKYWPSYSGPVILTYYAEPEPGKYFADQPENNGGLPEIFDIVAEFVFYRAVAEGWRFVREPSKFQQYADLWASGMKDTQRQYDNTDFVGSTMQVGNPYL